MLKKVDLWEHNRVDLAKEDPHLHNGGIEAGTAIQRYRRDNGCTMGAWEKPYMASAS